LPARYYLTEPPDFFLLTRGIILHVWQFPLT
jgi:hypothetical protein